MALALTVIHAQVATVDLSASTMIVIHNGRVVYRWAVSTARKGKWIPHGTHSAKWLSRHHKSSLYNVAPIAHAIFLRGNFRHSRHTPDRAPGPSGLRPMHPTMPRACFA